MPASHRSNNPASGALRFPRLRNEIGQLQRAPTGVEHFTFYGRGPNILFLGLGPEPTAAWQALRQHLNLPPAFPETTLKISFVECPSFAKAMQQTVPDWAKATPPFWRELQIKDLPDYEVWKALEQEHVTSEKICIGLYQPGLKLFPSFFVPLAARLMAWQHGLGAKIKKQAQPKATRLLNSKKSQTAPKILLAGSHQDLLIPDLIYAFEQEGFKFCHLPPSPEPISRGQPSREAPLCPPENLPQILPKLLAADCPDFFFSLNFKGLDPLGEVYHLLNTLGIKVATWCVDNPWHLLSSLRAPYWRDLTIFVTDASFIAPLKKHGAKEVYHLPLASSPRFFYPAAAAPRAHKLLFAGRTAFPNKNSFFAGCRLKENLLEESLLEENLLEESLLEESLLEENLLEENLLEENLPEESLQNSAPASASAKNPTRRPPDFNYWTKRLKINPLWPGQEVRRAGLAAEECSLLWRKSCVAAALPLGLTLYGDAGWKEVLPACAPNLRAPLDYYTELPDAYRAAEIVLSATSLLLPAGLNQRHFDAWAAGSICLTDNTPGLEIFPPELLEHICFNSCAELPLLARELLGSPALQAELKQSWQKLIFGEHTYAQRVRKIREILF